MCDCYSLLTKLHKNAKAQPSRDRSGKPTVRNERGLVTNSGGLKLNQRATSHR